MLPPHPPLGSLTRKQLRDMVRILVHVFSVNHDLGDNFDLFISYQTVLWNLAGRPDVAPEDRQMYIDGAMTAIEELLIIEEDNECLLKAKEVCIELSSRTGNEAHTNQLMSVHQEDFTAWGEELDKHLKEMKQGE